MYNNRLEILNLELTTQCPLRCPQCYCTLNTGKHLDCTVALHWIDEAAKIGVQMINLSGGETMCYPHLYEIIEYANSKGIKCNVALSGYRFDQEAYGKLVKAGVDGIYVSLNGSTEAVNQKSRNGYHLAISALSLLKEANFKNTTINWVMQSSNADDFEEMIRLAEEYKVSSLVVIGSKPDSENDLSKRPTLEQMLAVSNIIRKYRGSVKVCVESCYSPMLALVGQSFLLGNRNVGPDKGCLAGLCAASVNVDGLLSPCRHLYQFEKWDSLEAYWNESPILNKIRSLDDARREPCVSCKFNPYCRHCLAINSNVEGELFIGDKGCPLSQLP